MQNRAPRPPRPHTGGQSTGLRGHSPQEPAVPQPVLVPTDARARPQGARHLPLQHHRGGHDLGGETGAEPRKSREAERTLALLTGATQGGRRASVQGWVTATVHPPVRARRHAAGSLITHCQRRDYFMRVLDKTVTPALPFRFRGNEPSRPN